MTLRPRLMLFFGGLLFGASILFAAGEYQQTKDGKTFIWNGTPKPGESASWTGDRDKENYATGFGALTWYTANGKVYGLYYGNMVHGKLEGPVNVHTNGRTAHAYFVDGGRVTGWARGPAPSKMAIPEEAVVEKRRVQAERAEKAEAAAKAEARAATAAAEAEKKTKTEKVRPIEPVATKPETKPEEKAQKSEVSNVEKPAPEEVKKESEPAVTEKKSEPPPTTATPARAFDEPTPIATKSETKNRTPEVSSSPESSTPALETRATESARSSVDAAPPATEASVTERKSETSRQSSAANSDGDVSLNSLVGPPSSLRTTTETSKPKTETETSTSRDNAPLTESEAINLADTEARVEGFHLDDYQRPKVDHSAVKGKWSLFYGSKNAGESDRPFTVTVEDKTRKVEIRKNY